MFEIRPDPRAFSELCLLLSSSPSGLLSRLVSQFMEISNESAGPLLAAFQSTLRLKLLLTLWQ